MVLTCRELVELGARQADVADVLRVPLYVVQRATARVTPPGRKRHSAMTKRDIELALYPRNATPHVDPEPGVIMTVVAPTPDAPAAQLTEEERALVLAYWRSGMPAGYAKRHRDAAIQQTADNALPGLISIATVRAIVEASERPIPS